jgi:hypothetical protein
MQHQLPRNLRPVMRWCQRARGGKRGRKAMTTNWRIEVFVDGESVLDLGPDWQGGKSELTEQEEAAIRAASEHLAAFIGTGEESFIFDDDDDDLEDELEARRDSEEGHRTAMEIAGF